ncbi:response regulator [Herbaspirillum huttiense]|uniref:Response regulator n=1 Tax=Herbaspirillum huttiense subsp. lycopersici TaxID=3074428 RepID=A0ABU2EPY8_9BURK|nr:response regulator [Herbaspirillum huttiense]MDR9850189.1 response regulator [Herbaspirillum huttiense SE1]
MISNAILTRRDDRGNLLGKQNEFHQELKFCSYGRPSGNLASDLLFVFSVSLIAATLGSLNNASRTRSLKESRLVSLINETMPPTAPLTTKLLIVEDNSDVRAIYVELLQNVGYEVLEAANGAEAYTLLLSEHNVIDVILTDLRMPIMDGLEFATKVKNDTRLLPIPVVLVTATPMPNSWEARKIFSAVLTKPCPFNVLLSTLQAICE